MKSRILFLVTLLVLVGALGAGGYFYYDLTLDIQSLQESLATQREISNLKEDRLSDAIGLLEDQNYRLSENLIREEEKNEQFENQIRSLAGTVGDLEKLSTTDEELLQKYSRVYFLSEHYTPKNLSLVPDKWLFETNSLTHIHTQVLPSLLDLLRAAQQSDIELRIISAYRSFGEQGELKAGYTTTYGTGANQFSAEQGYSEHQLGTTVDFTTTELGADFTNLDQTNAYEWLQNNAYKYGFILSYPKGNTYYQFEPWHWRFVGTELAQDLHQRDIHFYDMSQREIDKYLVDLFE